MTKKQKINADNMAEEKFQVASTLDVKITETLEITKSYICTGKFNLGMVSGKPGMKVMLTDGQAAMFRNYIKED